MPAQSRPTTLPPRSYHSSINYQDQRAIQRCLPSLNLPRSGQAFPSNPSLFATGDGSVIFLARTVSRGKAIFNSSRHSEEKWKNQAPNLCLIILLRGSRISVTVVSQYQRIRSRLQPRIASAPSHWVCSNILRQCLIPPLGPRFIGAVKRTSVGLLNKVVIAYPRAWWPEAKTVSKYIILPSPQSSDGNTSLNSLLASTTLSVDNFANAVPQKPLLLLAFGAESARALEEFTDADISQAVHAILVKHFISESGTSEIAPLPPSGVLVTRWGQDPYARGATSTPVRVPVTDDMIDPSPLDFIELSRAAWNGTLGFAGEHTDFDHHGSVAGAIISGAREAKRISDLLLREQ